MLQSVIDRNVYNHWKSTISHCRMLRDCFQWRHLKWYLFLCSNAMTCFLFVQLFSLSSFDGINFTLRKKTRNEHLRFLATTSLKISAKMLHVRPNINMCWLKCTVAFCILFTSLRLRRKLRLKLDTNSTVLVIFDSEQMMSAWRKSGRKISFQIERSECYWRR